MSPFKKITAALCAVVLWTACVTCFPDAVNTLDVSAGKSLSELEAEKKELEAERESIRSELKKLESKADEQEKYQQYYAEQIAVQERELDNINAQADAIEADIAELTQRISDKKAEIDENTQLFRERVRAMYIAGNTSYAEVIAGSDSFYDVLARVEMVKRVSAHDKDMIDDLNNTLKVYNADCELLNERLTEQKAAQTEQEKVLSELQESYNNSAEVISMLKAEADDYAVRSAEIDAEEEEVEKALQAEIKRLASAQKVFVGSDFTWPAPTVHNTSDGYGWRDLFGQQKFHKGLDITKPGCAGMDIVAAQSGTVILAQKTYTPGYSYGKYVIIDHGGGYTTLYGHCSEVYVSVGQTVAKGDKIAAIGNTGNSYGAHLHFEIRVNGQHTDPMQYFTKQ